MNVEIFKDCEEFYNREDKYINGVSEEFLSDNDLTLDNVNLVDCIGCWNCANCINCDYCEYCEYAVDCFGEDDYIGSANCFITSLIKHFN